MITVYIYDYSIYIYICMIIYDIWMCLKVGYAENQVFFKGIPHFQRNSDIEPY